VTLLAPFGLLLVLGLVPGLAAFIQGQRRAGRACSRLGLRPPGPLQRVTATVALCLAAALLTLAASRPVVREPQARYTRTDVEAIFALDISRSMLAAASPAGPTRFDRAKAAAKTIRAAIPDVPAGVATFTDRALPNLFPTSDEGVFSATIDRSVGVDRPPPVGSALTVTTFDALAALRGYFTPGRRHRLLVILSDGESRDFSASLLRATLGRAPGIQTVLVRFGSSNERVFGREGLPETDYRPASTAETIRQFVQTTKGPVFDEGRLGQAEAAVKEGVERGPRVRIGMASTPTQLAPVFVLAAFIPLGFLLWQRNLLQRPSRRAREKALLGRRSGAPDESGSISESRNSPLTRGVTVRRNTVTSQPK
jgi:von Willebrand factor type A domain